MVDQNIQAPLSVDVERMMQYYYEAAEGGNVQAMYSLGAIYQKGISSIVSADIEKTVMYWEKAVAGGYTPALYNLAVIYANGQGNFKGDIGKAVSECSRLW